MKLALLEHGATLLCILYILHMCVQHVLLQFPLFSHSPGTQTMFISKTLLCVMHFFRIFIWQRCVFFFCFFVARCDHHCVVECMRFGVLLDNTNVSIVCKTMFMYFKQKSSCISNPTNTILRWFKTLKYPHVNTDWTAYALRAKHIMLVIWCFKCHSIPNRICSWAKKSMEKESNT